MESGRVRTTQSNDRPTCSSWLRTMTPQSSMSRKKGATPKPSFAVHTMSSSCRSPRSERNTYAVARSKRNPCSMRVRFPPSSSIAPLSNLALLLPYAPLCVSKLKTANNSTAWL